MVDKRYFVTRNPDYGYRSADPLPAASELAAFYEHQYYQANTGQYSPKYDPEEVEFFRTEARVSLFVYRRAFGESPGKKSFLDVGCGEGFHAGLFADEGWSVTCCDYSTHGVDTHNPGLKSRVIKGDVTETLEALAAREARFSIINLKNVLEHVIDPPGLLLRLRRLMDEHSMLVVNVPNDYSPFQEHLAREGHTPNTWFSPPEHLHYFQFPTLRALLAGTGFGLLSMQGGFPIEAFLANPHSNYAKDRSKGKAAHRARVNITNHLSGYHFESFVAMREAFAGLHFGRDAIAYAALTAPGAA